MMPPVASMPKGSNPQGDKNFVRKEHVVLVDVVRLMRSFQRLSEALISCLDRYEARVPEPPNGPPRALVDTGRIHQELEKVKFPEFFGPLDGAAAKA
jgi:hypothetical protein